jgi:hypothetical protein
MDRLRVVQLAMFRFAAASAGSGLAPRDRLAVSVVELPREILDDFRFAFGTNALEPQVSSEEGGPIEKGVLRHRPAHLARTSHTDAAATYLVR